MTVAWPKVLIVDDDAGQRHLMQEMLSRAGYEVRNAEDANAALAAIEEDCPHYLLTDWLMPGMTGVELCRQVRQLELPHYLYVFIITWKSEQSAVVEGLSAGADDFLVKPIRADELLARMQTGARILALERRLREMARIDPLTGVLSRRAFHEQAERELRRASRHRLPLSCVMIDIDYFKKVNDTHGHPAGDTVLRELGQILQANCRGGDYLGRYGGEEFCALLTETREEGALVWAERARSAVHEGRIKLGNTALAVSASFGVAELLNDTAGVSALIDMADQALLVAKQSGRDRVVPYRALTDAGSLAMAGVSNPFEGVVARNVMSAVVACLREDETVGQATEFLLRFRINSCPVVDEQGKLSGVLSEKDVIATLTEKDCWSKPVRAVMQRNVVSYEEEAPVKAIYDFLCRVSIRRVVIVHDGVPTGIISRGSLLRWYSNWLTAHGHGAALTEGADDRPELQCKKLADGQTSALTPRQHMAYAARTIAHEATALQQALATGSEDCLPLLIDRASRIQELVNDVLADSRSFINPA